MATVEAMDAGGQRRRADDRPPREIVSFRLAGQDYCIDIMSIREIRRWTPPTALPQAPSHVLGLINLRGQVLPIIDLAQRLGLPSPEPTARSVIIVACVGGQAVGLVVDGVSDILAVRESAIQPPPALATGQDGETCLQGIVSLGDRMVRFLDLERVLPGRPGDEG